MVTVADPEVVASIQRGRVPFGELLAGWRHCTVVKVAGKPLVGIVPGGP